MYFQLTGAVGDRIIEELRRFWSYHPQYRDRLPENIKGSHSFKDRPQVGIIVKVGGGTNVQLSADNYVAQVESYVYLTRFKDKPGLSIEWIREDSVAIQRNGGVCPSPPGIYFVDVVGDHEFVVDVLLDKTKEQVTKVDETCQVYSLNHPPLPGTLRLFEMPSGFLLQGGTNYTVDGAGVISLTAPLTGGRWLEADYRTIGEIGRGPFPIFPNRANNTAIPGAVLAFGRRYEKGDKMAVVVQPIRRPSALEYGGHWEISIEVEVFARDIHEAREIVDYSAIYLWGVLRSRMISEGVEMKDLSMGGETEEVYDENADDYFYGNSLSMTIRTDWSIHIPLAVFIRQAIGQSTDDMARVAALSDDELGGEIGSIRMLDGMGLEEVTDPFFLGRTRTFEAIK